MAGKRLGIVVDTTRCTGCHTCGVACKLENNLPAEVWWSRAVTASADGMNCPQGTYPDLTMTFFTIQCQHCENPACVKVCPVGATHKDLETGIVLQDYDKCIGCRMCIAACPYTGVRSFNWEEPKHYVDFSFGDADVPAHQKHVVEKCTMCWHRQVRGETPACVEACPAYARFWGDLNDPSSEVSQLIRTREYKQLLPEEGTNPSVYYLV